MDSSNIDSTRRSRSWWRLWTALLFIFAATLGLGFYLPLQKTHQVLKQELAAAQGSATELRESLARATASIDRVSAERSELSKYKDEVASQNERYPELAKRLAAEADGALRAAQEKSQVVLGALGDGVRVAFESPVLLNEKRNVLTQLGVEVLCATIKRTTQLSLPEITVRTHVPDGIAPRDAEAAYTSAATLAAGIAHQATRCGVAANRVSVASSPAGKHRAAVEFEFRPAAGE